MPTNDLKLDVAIKKKAHHKSMQVFGDSAGAERFI